MTDKLNTQKEKNFISAVVYLNNQQHLVVPFFDNLLKNLSENFEKYEIICVNDCCKDNTIAEVKKYFAENYLGTVTTIINMSIRQGLELSMNAGLDLAIGDFVLEFDSLELCYDETTIIDAYNQSQQGYDIVTVGSKKSKKLSSSLFYKIFNCFSESNYKLQGDIFHLLSRRAINRLHAINQNMPYRKAAYATSGLKVFNIECNFKSGTDKKLYPFSQALDVLALYTNAAYKLSLTISVLMLMFTVFSALYTVVMFFFMGNTIEGWATTMAVLSAGFFGIFLILAIIIKYLSLLVDLIFKNQKYLIESIEKI